MDPARYAAWISVLGLGVAYRLRNEQRLTRLETKIDLVMRKLGLDP